MISCLRSGFHTVTCDVKTLLSVALRRPHYQGGADYLRISEASVWRLLKDKQLRRVRIGGRTVIRRMDLDAFLEGSLDPA